MMLDMAQPQAEEAANQPLIDETAQVGEQSAHDAQNDAYLTVRYNKEELPLSREAAVEYAQKGLNYDKISGRLAEVTDKLEEYADLEALAKELAAQNGVSEKEALAAIKKRMGDERDKQAEVNEQLDAFINRYPDADPLALPETVLTAWKSGVPLEQAYAAHLREAQMQSQARQTNAQNAAASMGGARGTDTATPRPLSEDSIRQMTPAELEKNHNRIWAYLTGQRE